MGGRSKKIFSRTLERVRLSTSSEFMIFSKAVVPPKDSDVVMVAPKMIGEGVRDLYLKKEADEEDAQ